MDQKKTQAFFEGREIEAYNIFGAHVLKKGVRFTVYAPNAQAISVVGDFNEWDGTKNLMKKDDQGIWSCVVKEAKKGDSYKYRVTQATGRVLDKADPYAFFSELRPKTNSIISSLEYNKWSDEEWMKNRTKCYDKPVNIYEMHVGSWKKDEDVDFVKYSEIEKDLIAHCKKHNYTHVELMPLGEYPFDGSWGYQCTGYFSSTARYGKNDELKRFVNNLHKAGIGVIMDFVPVHFVKDEYALAYWDGTPLYEYSRDEDAHSEWGTYNFDLWREEVRSFLMSAANFWLEVYHFDGLRMDAISNAIFWKGNKNRGVNEGACIFMRRMNHLLNEKHNGSIMLIAEDSSDFPNVTKPEFDGGLGFDYKWDLGWMNDTLSYLKRDPIYRQWHHNDITFSMAYFYSERFICPFSHDEVVHGKATIVNKMWGTYEDKFAQARALYTYMYAHPGKKLNFMGNEIGMMREWDETKGCDWFLLDYPMHDAFEKYLADLQAIYAGSDAFWNGDYNPLNFQWIDADNRQKNLFSFIRKGTDKDYVIIINFSTNTYQHEQFGVISKGLYKEVLNSQWDKYNGTWKDPIPQSCQAVRLPRNNQSYMIEVSVPAFGATIFEVEK
ncbi:MAG: 1,4-alpha-glucan branching protein GlgB [Bacillota bacterium]|nr:1,4-alpha-glucan branching protein GlgB [Bacillota bacterium]